jgi:hypothetical protein
MRIKSTKVAGVIQFVGTFTSAGGGQGDYPGTVSTS